MMADNRTIDNTSPADIYTDVAKATQKRAWKCSAFMCICDPVPHLIIRLFNSPNNYLRVLETPGFKVVFANCNEQRK